MQLPGSLHVDAAGLILGPGPVACHHKVYRARKANAYRMAWSADPALAHTCPLPACRFGWRDQLQGRAFRAASLLVHDGCF